MSYATQASMVDQFGEAELVELTDRGEAALGLIDAAVLDRALVAADTEVDSYLGVRYALPLAWVPARLTQLAGDLARYHLYVNTPPDGVAQRYKDAVKALQAIADGRVTLGLPEAKPMSPSGEAQIATPARKLFHGGFR